MQKKVISGILLVDKPIGLSSQAVVAKAKYLLKSNHHDSKKAGHTGTLDPMATGLLPVCFGEATKFSSFGLDADKGYHAIIKLGEQTDTGDKEGQVIKCLPTPSFSQADLDNVAHVLTGEQLQTPPMYSALKKDGKKLYEYARDGIEIEREARPIVIHKLVLNKISHDEIGLMVVCSKGTYVRVLGESVAEQLGTVGHLIALRRTSTGGFDVGCAISLDELEALSQEERLTKLLPVDEMIGHLPRLAMDEGQTQRLFLGQRLNVKSLITDDFVFDDEVVAVRLYHQDAFIGLGELSHNGRLQPKKMISSP